MAKQIIGKVTHKEIDPEIFKQLNLIKENCAGHPLISMLTSFKEDTPLAGSIYDSVEDPSHNL